MIEEISNKFLDTFTNVSQPFTGSIADWAKENVVLNEIYGIPGKLDFTTSPWLVPPLEDVLNPKVTMVIKIMAVRLGKSLTDEATIPYWINQNPGPIFRIFQDDDAASLNIETRLLPILRNIKCIAPLLPDRKGIKKGLIKLPNTYIRYSGDKESVAHGPGTRYLILDEAHLYDVGMIEKFIARTLDFAGRRKIIISSTPNQYGSELEKYYLSGQIFEWHWKCPHCSKYQPYWWSKQRDDLSFGGFNWDTILTADGEHTDVDKSSETTWLECFYCKHQIHDNLENRRKLNNDGKYICIKSDGDSTIHSYTCPLFVNLNLPFKFFTMEYLKAKRMKQIGLDDDMMTFVCGKLAKFYKAEPVGDDSRIMRGDYIPNPTDYEKDWVNIMTVDCQARGDLKYYVIRAWNKNGNESRRLAFGVCRTFNELDEIRKKWNVRVPCVGVDSGWNTTQIYQECIKHNEDIFDPVLKRRIFVSWIPMKGDGNKSNYIHDDNVSRFYAPLSKQDPLWPSDSKYYGRTAKLLLWSNYSIKTILANLRDNTINGIKWLVDVKDAEYERQLYSEGLKEEFDKKTGLKRLRWSKIGDANEYLDCEAMNLVLAIRINVFSATNVDEKKIQEIMEKTNTKKE